MRSDDRELAQDQLCEAIAAVLATEQGKQCFFWLLELCGIYEDGFELDTGLMSYRIGRQSVGKQIIAQMSAIDEGFYPRFLLAVAEMKQQAMGRNKARQMKQQEMRDE